MIHDVFLHVLIGVKAKGVTALLVKRLSIAGLVAFKIQERERGNMPSMHLVYISLA